jgi:predicted small integral membrane protein
MDGSVHLLEITMIERLAKITLVAAVALYFAVVALNNVTDYGSNLAFVQHVLAMDTTFPGNKLSWRALTSPSVHHVFYAGIILWEAVSALVIGLGAVQLWRERRTSAPAFNAAKSAAIGALAFSLLLWFTAFLTVGGEWFVMWQSHTWNGQDAAFRMFGCIALILLFLKTPDPELPKA